MRYSIEPRERRYVKGYSFLSFARNFNDKYGKSLRNASKTFAKTAGKEILKETAKTTGDLIGTKIAEKITAKPSKKNHMTMKLLMEYQKKDIYLLKKDKKLLMN